MSDIISRIRKILKSRHLCHDCGKVYAHVRMTKIQGKWYCWSSCWGNAQHERLDREQPKYLSERWDDPKQFDGAGGN